MRVLKPRVPAFDALDPGDLVIVPGPSLAVVAPGAGQLDEVVAALARARVPAVLLTHGDTGSTALAALGAAAAAVGLVVLDLGRTDPSTLERSIIGFLVNRRAELDRRAGDLEGELARLALRGEDLDVLVAAVATFLGRAVAVEGRRGDVLAVHAPTDGPAVAASVAAYLARPSGDVALRVPIQAPAAEPGGGGRLVLLGDEPTGELERIVAERAAALLALELAREDAVRQAREDALRSHPLPVDGPPWVVLLAVQRGAPGGPDDLSAREAVRAELRMMVRPARLLLRGNAESLELRMVAAAPADDPEGRRIAARLADYLGRTVAVSRPFREAGERPAAEAAARATLEAAETLAAPPPVALAARMPAYQLLANVRNLPDGLRQARALLAPVLGGRPEQEAERLATLEAVLGTPSLGEAAQRLGVHRNTITYRVRSLERRGEWDLADPDLRFALALAIRIVQHAQS